jgi:hypothetical protein
VESQARRNGNDTRTTVKCSACFTVLSLASKADSAIARGAGEMLEVEESIQSRENIDAAGARKYNTKEIMV